MKLSATGLEHRWLALTCLATFAVVTAACGHVELTALTFRGPLSPRSSAAIYPLGTAIPVPYVDVAMVQATGYGDDANSQTVLAALATKAAALGCDAVARVQFASGATRTNAVGVCVRYVDAAAVAPEPERLLSQPLSLP